jgi:hypothetical protein
MSPFGEILGMTICPGVSYRLLPMGNSSTCPPGTARTMASWAPSGDQSANVTFSATSRGEPPDTGARAKVPARGANQRNGRGLRSTAISPVREIAAR